MKDFLSLLVGHKLHNPVGINLIGGLIEPRSIVAGFDNDVLDVDTDSLVLVAQTLLELSLLKCLKGLLIFLSGVLVLGLHLANLLERLDCQLVLVQEQVG